MTRILMEDKKVKSTKGLTIVYTKTKKVCDKCQHSWYEGICYMCPKCNSEDWDNGDCYHEKQVNTE